MENTPIEPTQTIDQSGDTHPTSRKSNNLLLLVAGAFLLAVGGIGGYYLGIQNKSEPVISTQQIVVPTEDIQNTTSPSDIPVSTSETENWKIYTSTYEGASFQYPPNWTLKIVQTVDPAVEGVELKSQEGLTVAFAPSVSGLGGGCPPEECPVVKTLSVDKLTGTNSTVDLYLVKNSYNNIKRMGIMSPFKGVLAASVGEKKGFPYYMLFVTKNNGMGWFEVTANEEMYQKMTDEKFFSLPEVKTAEKILSSLKYQ